MEKLLPPHNRPVPEIATLEGTHQATLYSIKVRSQEKDEQVNDEKITQGKASQTSNDSIYISFSNPEDLSKIYPMLQLLRLTPHLRLQTPKKDTRIIKANWNTVLRSFPGQQGRIQYTTPLASLRGQGRAYLSVTNAQGEDVTGALKRFVIALVEWLEITNKTMGIYTVLLP